MVVAQTNDVSQEVSVSRRGWVGEATKHHRVRVRACPVSPPHYMMNEYENKKLSSTFGGGLKIMDQSAYEYLPPPIGVNVPPLNCMVSSIFMSWKFLSTVSVESIMTVLL